MSLPDDASLDTGAMGFPTLATAERLKGDPLKAQSEVSMEDLDKIQALAVSYKVTGDTRWRMRLPTCRTGLPAS
jgi:hypothetical protein